MSTEIETKGVETGTTIPGETSAPETAAPERSESETRARSMGWKPKEEFRGDESKWVDHDEFVRRGEEELPVLRERNRDMARRFSEMEARVQRQEREFNERVQRQERMASIALQEQRASIEAQYEAAKLQAVEIGDRQRYEQLNRDQRQAVRQFDDQVYQQAAPQQPQGQQVAPEVRAKVDSWAVENPWFFTDQGLNQYAQAVHVHLQRTKPGMSVDENLAEVARTVREKYPDKFGAGTGRAAAVEGGSSVPASGKRAKGVADLPPEARRAAEEFVRAGAFKNVGEYAKSYWSMES